MEVIKVEPIHIIAMGGGVQSTTMALLAEHELIKPKPTAAIFADPRWENPATYQWLDELATKLSFPIYRVYRGNIRQDNIDARNGLPNPASTRWGSMPFYVTDVTGSGREGKSKRQCTDEYKIEPMEKKAAALAGYPGKGRPRKLVVVQWIGISTDEASRMNVDRRAWIERRYPLALELRWSRADCIAWLERNYYPVPPRSSCVGCPFHSDAQWLEIKRNDPGMWEEAVAFDKAIRNAKTMKGESYLHRSLKPLDQAPLKGEHNLDLFKNECKGVCGL